MKIKLTELDSQNKYERLHVEVAHVGGAYRLYVRHEFVEIKGGYEVCTSVPFANGNFSRMLKIGRKTVQQLDKFNSSIERQAGELAVLWKDGQYSEMTLRIVLEVL